jgi:predicted phage terminase large subunit-like protein
MISPALLHKQGFKYFVREAFRQLHPNHPPLQLTWYMQAMCHALEQTSSGACRRLVINVPPRHGKSITAAVAFCAWILGQDPSAKILVGTYNEDLARLHDRQLKLIMESAEYRAAFPATVVDRKTTRQLELRTTAGGFRMAVTTGGSATGFGGDYIILDDCMKAQDAGSEAERIRVRDWYRGTVGTRLDNKGDGVIISIQQRLHEDDLTSYILDAGATHLNLPAIAQQSERIPIGPNAFHQRQPGDLLAPERENQETLNELRRELGSAVFGPQWLQDPTPPEGNIVRLEWFPRYDAMPERHRFLKVVQSWDTAFSAEPGSAYSVCTTWGYLEGRWYLLDVTRERLEYYDLKRRVISLHRKWKPDCVLIERASSGLALWQDLRTDGSFRPIMWQVAKSKEERLRAQTGQMESGKIVLPQNAVWLEGYLHELKGAPSCRYWDQVDSTTQFLEFSLSRKGWIDQDFDPISGRKITVRRAQSINRR